MIKKHGNLFLIILGLILLHGNSMHPFLKDGNLVWAENESEISAFEVDDLVVFQFEGETPVLHRVYKKGQVGEKIFLLTKGDNNNYLDGRAVLKEHIIGKVNVINAFSKETKNKNKQK